MGKCKNSLCNIQRGDVGTEIQLMVTEKLIMGHQQLTMFKEELLF